MTHFITAIIRTNNNLTAINTVKWIVYVNIYNNYFIQCIMNYSLYIQYKQKVDVMHLIVVKYDILLYVI